MKISVSILKSNYSEEETINRINETDATYLHLDVMDGKFVKGITPKREHLDKSNKKIQVHLMVSNPFSYIGEYSYSQVDTFIIQAELDEDIKALLKYIKDANYKCGLALKPETEVYKILDYIDLVDYVLVLTVNPGAGGQEMMMDTLYKINTLKKIRNEKNLSYEIIVDGGVNDKTIEYVKDADIVVSGSYVCSCENFQNQIDNLMKK